VLDHKILLGIIVNTVAADSAATVLTLISNRISLFTTLIIESPIESPVSCDTFCEGSSIFSLYKWTSQFDHFFSLDTAPIFQCFDVQLLGNGIKECLLIGEWYWRMEWLLWKCCLQCCKWLILSKVSSDCIRDCRVISNTNLTGCFEIETYCGNCRVYSVDYVEIVELEKFARYFLIIVISSLTSRNDWLQNTLCISKSIVASVYIFYRKY
jgi:hypothetical protein